MKTKILILLFSIFALPLFANIIIISKNPEGYRVSYYVNKDGSAEVLNYKNADDLGKVLPVLSKAATGLTKNSDRVTIFLNEDHSVNRVDHQVNSTGKEVANESIVKQDESSAEIHEFKDEIHDKLGIPKPPPPEPPPEPIPDEP